MENSIPNSSTKHNNIDNSLEIETSSIIDAIRADWRSFDRYDLIKLNASLENILQKEKISISTFKKEDSPGYFDKITKDYRDEGSNIATNNNTFPIRSFFIANTRKSYIIDILDPCVLFVLKADHPNFKQFFAYRLATLPSNKIEPFLSYQLNKSFNNDIKSFRYELKFVLSDFHSVLGGRKAIIESIITEMFPEPIIQPEIYEDNTIPSANVPTIFQFNNDNLKRIFCHGAINTFIEVEKSLLENGYIDTDGKWANSISILISLILTLEQRHYFKKLRAKTTLRSKRAVYRIFFKERYQVDFTNQMQPGQIEKADLPDTHKHLFGNIPEIKL